MSYVDGFVAAVPNENKQAFLEHAKIMATALKQNGALKVVDCWGDDVPTGEVTSFPMAVQKKEDETVVFSWVIWPSKEARDTGWSKAMEDPNLHPDKSPMPFDGKRLIYGGFDLLSDE